MRHSTQDARHCVDPDTGHGGGLLLVIMIGLALSIAAGLLSSRSMLRGVTAVPAPAAVPGSSLEEMVQVTSQDGATLQVRRLARRGQGYAPAAETLHLTLTPDTRYVMGGRADLKPGAVLQVKGIVQDVGGQLLRVSQAVILTGYVQVTP